MSSSAPQQLGEFEILEKLGHGGMGAVYKARQHSLGRLVALKVLPANMANDAEFIGRFKAEARAAGSLNHPGIVQVYAAGEDAGVHWFAMEFVDGESLQGRLARKGRIEPMEAIAICAHVATALHYGWQRARLIHRDIKPDNIFLSRDGEVKLGDLGLAKSVGSENAALTQTGTSMGTPFYISPEQARGDAVIDFRSDIYSLGGTLFHLLCGRPPYTGSGPMALMLKHITDPVPDIFQAWPECPKPIGPLLTRMLAKDPAARPQSYEKLIEDMMAVHARLQKLTSRPAVRKLPRGRSRQGPATWTYAAIGGAVLALVGGMALFMPGKKPSPAPPPMAAATPASQPVASTPSPSVAPENPDADAFVALFNGHDLNGWSGDPKHWSVRDGVIVGEATPANPINSNTFLIWKGDPVEDFVLQASFILTEGNSGFQYRSRMIDPANWVLGGYQFDLDARQAFMRGSIYEERGSRGILAGVGERTHWRRDGTKEVLSTMNSNAAWRIDRWNSIRLTARGNHFVQELNDVTVAETFDDDSARQTMSGLIGIQMVSSKNTKAQFRDILLKRLPRSGSVSTPPTRAPVAFVPTPTPIPATPTPAPVAVAPASAPAPTLFSEVNPSGGVTYQPFGAAGRKHIVLIAGDEEYRSEEALPQLAKILAAYHGFKCTVLFPISTRTGEIDPTETRNEPGLEALDTADLCLVLARYQAWPDVQMKHFVDYYLAGKPFVALRTSTHLFSSIATGSPFARFNFYSPVWTGGFGRQVLGETWISHWGQHKAQGTRAMIEPSAATDPIVRGVSAFTVLENVYEAAPPPDAKILLRGQVLAGFSADSGAVGGRKKRMTGQDQEINSPMMPVAWSREVRNELGRTNRVFTCTLGAASEVLDPNFRRLMINASYWAMGLNAPDDSKVALVGDYRPRASDLGGAARGLKPVDFLLPKASSLPVANRPASTPVSKTTLFDGAGTAEWKAVDGQPAGWPVTAGVLEVGLGDIQTKREFQDFLLHAEFWIPLLPPNVTGQNRGNSGIFLQNRYELQILDSFGLPPSIRDCGAIYNQRAPDFNACAKPETWQTYDVNFHTARFDATGHKTANARVTITLNGVIIHNNAEILGGSPAASAESPYPGAIRLQAHGEKVRFRNIWVSSQ